MCGRTACALSKESICRAAYCPDRHNGQYVQWFATNSMDSYEPNFNQTVGSVLPVLVQRKAIDKSWQHSGRSGPSDQTLVLTPMRWGLRPHWIKSSDQSFKANPINCRFETMTEKTMFSTPLKSGRRCVVLANGFFEWKTNKDNSKDPYFLYCRQKYVDLKSADTDWARNEAKLLADNQWKGPELISLAALFNISDDNSMSFAIITVPMHSSMEWLHNRMPAILDTDDKVRDWLDFGNVSVDSATKLLAPFDGLEYHSVSRLVSKVQNNSIENILPQKRTQKTKTIDHWFKPKKTTNSGKPCEDIKAERDGTDVKKIKEEVNEK